MRYKTTGLKILCFFFLLVSMAVANTNERLWSSLTLNKKSGKYSYQIEPQLRLKKKTNQYDRTMLNAGAGYSFTDQSQLWLGGTTEQIGSTPTARANYEYRFWQQMINTGSLKSLNLILRSRAELRKRGRNPQWNYRLRERLNISKNLTNSLSLVGYDEIFFNLNRPSWVAPTTIPQNRVSLGLSQLASENIRFTVGYMYQTIFDKPTSYGHVLLLNMEYNR